MYMKKIWQWGGGLSASSPVGTSLLILQRSIMYGILLRVLPAVISIAEMKFVNRRNFQNNRHPSSPPVYVCMYVSTLVENPLANVKIDFCRNAVSRKKIRKKYIIYMREEKLTGWAAGTSECECSKSYKIAQASPPPPSG